MEKMYMLRVNDNYLFFRKLDDVKMWFKDNGVEDNLISVDEDEYSLDELEEIVGMSLDIENECLVERGDEYCNIYLEVITFEY
jgi:arsenate reductase-like glutaredoxin family protein